jgi:hypothetical protein
LAFFIAFTVHPVFADSKVDFNRDIRPILSDRCFHCHGPDESGREAALRFDDEQSAKEFAIVPGDASESEMLRRIISEDDDERMPPPEMGKPISKEQIDLIRRWIDEGAEWSAHWAYVPPKKHDIPQGNDGSASVWRKNWIDDFVLGRLKQEGLSPSEVADPVSLVRRLCFDLTGLPPTADQLNRFLAIKSDADYSRFVDTLLNSSAYGERMAMYWLDLVRFADTVGYHGDQDHNISPYRDYVVEAFNRNLSFDQFTREQLAGDLLPESTESQKIATGYNRLLQTSHEGGVQAKEYLAIYAADRVRNVSNVWMGATVGCAQCHDHKYDPYTAKDFYSLAAFFDDIDDAAHLKNGTNALPTRREPELLLLDSEEKEKIDSLTRQLAEAKSKSSKLTAFERKAKVKELNERIKSIRAGARKSMITVALAKPRTTRVLPRGDWLDESGPIVEPAIPEFLGVLDTNGRATRLDLANWLTDTANGDGLKTARVFANRFWYLLFGQGLATVLDDLGGQGEPPVHPELLDNLAIEFAGSGWDVKHMMRLIVSSAAYRQTSERDAQRRQVDPDNRWIASQSSYRLPAEMVRDNALAISGLLVHSVGGDSVKPYQPSGYYQHLNFPTRKYKPHNDARQWRRGVYVHWQRQYLHPMLKAFDAPSREECTAKRPRSNTPLAALTLLNDPTFVEAARVFAEMIVKHGGESDAKRLAYAYQRAVSRSPDEWEAIVLTRLLDSQRKHYGERLEDAKKLIGFGIAEHRTEAKSNPQLVDLAAWTCVARAILNLDETITRN